MDKTEEAKDIGLPEKPKEKQPMKKRQMVPKSEEHQEKLSIAATKHWEKTTPEMRTEFREKISASLTGRKPNESSKRRDESPESYESKLAKRRKRESKPRVVSPETRERRKAQARVPKDESAESRAKRCAAQKKKLAGYLAKMTPEERERRLAVRAKRNADRRAAETPEERAKRLEANRKRTAARFASETPEERARRLAARAKTQAERKAIKTSKQKASNTCTRKSNLRESECLTVQEGKEVNDNKKKHTLWTELLSQASLTVDPEIVQAAVYKVAEGNNMQEVATDFGLKYNVLNSHYAKWKRLNIMPEEDELSLVSYLHYLSSHGFILIKKLVYQAVMSFVEKLGKDSSYAYVNMKTGPSDEWWREFQKKNPGLEFQNTLSVCSSAGNRGVPNHDLSKYHKQLHPILINHGVKLNPERIFNCGQMDLLDIVKSQKSVTEDTESSSNTYETNSADHSTVHLCVSGSGKILAPFIVFKASLQYQPSVRSLPEDWVLETSETGGMSNNLFQTWFDTVFLPNCRSTESKPVLLLVDNRSLLLGPEVIQSAEDNNITVWNCPEIAHIRLRPLDHGILDSLKCGFSKQLDSMSCSVGSFNPDNLLLSLKHAISSLSADEIKAAFRQTILHPFSVKDRILSEGEEKTLSNYIHYLSKYGFLVTNKLIKLAVISIMKKSKRKVKGNLDMDKGPSDNWCKIFCYRHSAMTIYQAFPNYIVDNTTSKANFVKQYFVLLKSTLDKLNLEGCSAQIFNFGEMVLEVGDTCTTCEKSEKEAGANSEGTNLEHCTINLTVSGSGQILSPCIIMSKTHARSDLVTFRKILPDDWMLRRSENGLMNEVLFQEWFDIVFLPNCGFSEKTPVLLLVDNSSCILGVEVLETARANNIHILHCPANSSYVLQPLESDILSFIKKHMADQARKRCLTIVSQLQCLRMFENAVSELSTEHITMAFSRSGIIPFQSKVPDVYCVNVNKTEAAFAKVKEGCAVEAVGIEFGLHLPYLLSYCTAFINLSPNEDGSLIQFLKYLPSHGFPVTMTLLRHAILSILRKSDEDVRTTLLMDPLVLDYWCEKYRSRISKIVSVLNEDYQIPMNPAKYYDFLSVYLRRHNLTECPAQIFCCGYKSLTGLLSPMQETDHNFHTSWSNEPQPRGSVLHLCVSRSGQVLPPFMVLAKSFTENTAMEDCTEDFMITTTESGCMSEELFQKWFYTVFLPNCGSSRTQSVLLLMDNSSFVLGPEVIKLAELNHVCIVNCPSREQLFQPLDYSIFRILKSHIMVEITSANSLANPVSAAQKIIIVKDGVSKLTTRIIQTAFHFTFIKTSDSNIDQVRSVDPEVMEAAFVMIMEGNSVETVVKEFDLISSVFYEFCLEYLQLSSSGEQSLIEYLDYLYSHGFPITMALVKQAVISIMKTSTQTFSETMNIGTCEHWFTKLKLRRPNMGRFTDNLTCYQMATTSKEYAELLKKTLSEVNLICRSAQIYNCGNCAVIQSLYSTLLKSKSSQHDKKVTNTTKCNATLHMTVSGLGQILPSFVVLPKAEDTDNTVELPEDWVLRRNENGCFNEYLFKEWFDTVFLPNCGSAENRPVLLLVENKPNVLGPDVIQSAKSNNVHILHCSSSLQPLQPLEGKLFKHVVDRFREENFKASITSVSQILFRIKNALSKLTLQDFVTAFQLTGIIEQVNVPKPCKNAAAKKNCTAINTSGLPLTGQQTPVASTSAVTVQTDPALQESISCKKNGEQNDEVELDIVFKQEQEEGDFDYNVTENKRVEARELQPVALYVNQQFNPLKSTYQQHIDQTALKTEQNDEMTLKHVIKQEPVEMDSEYEDPD